MMSWLVRHFARRNAFAFSAIALLLPLLLTACGQPAHSAPRARPTATPHGPQLAWHAVTTPEGGVVTVAPGNGDIAYMCVANGSSRVAIWATHDRSAHWMHVSDIPVSVGTHQCHLTVDGLQSNTVVVAVVAVKLGASPPVRFFTSYVTFDGGNTWHRLSKQPPYLAFQFSTLAGVVYGYLRVASGPQGEEAPELATSSDQMQTWHPILRNISDIGGFGSTAFWLNPTNGALLVRDTSTLWSSTDAGAHWKKISVPDMTSPSENIVVQAPVANQPWHLCAANYDSLIPKNPQPNTLTCSMDGGQTWQPVPAINLSFTTVKGTFVAPMGVFALADDGAALATAGGFSSESVYRLPPGGQQWQSLGSIDLSNFVRYYPSPGNGVLWDNSSHGLLAASYP